MAVEIRAGINKPYATFINEAKQGLKDKGMIELHGLGDSITNVIKVGDMLSSQGYADLTSFHTLTLDENREGKTWSKPKVIISLKRSATFDKAYNEYESRRSARNN
ncbi:hypothetical protein SteCoe_12976 [Stentor coeruleus]|uniref:DNA/RNA-binding protein Alba-like domain-containing protein n=1 Tax=Stentor coeruleus TaxID=5963 RepID=A0A1R2C9G6_9CILI|nr:hypothetical protein SteCoe_12976 [Stentor coeruleus]